MLMTMMTEMTTTEMTDVIGNDWMGKTTMAATVQQQWQWCNGSDTMATAKAIAMMQQQWCYDNDDVTVTTTAVTMMTMSLWWKQQWQWWSNSHGDALEMMTVGTMWNNNAMVALMKWWQQWQQWFHGVVMAWQQHQKCADNDAKEKMMAWQLRQHATTMAWWQQWCNWDGKNNGWQQCNGNNDGMAAVAMPLWPCNGSNNDMATAAKRMATMMTHWQWKWCGNYTIAW